MGKQFTVVSSFGHVRDLPKKKLGVDIEKKFEPEYSVPDKSKKVVQKLKTLAKKTDDVYYATDEDREGEAIAWHLQELLCVPSDKIKRIVFHEITKEAIMEALEKPRTIDQHLVNAQQARRIVDRLVGYQLSPFLWDKVARGLSAGRVQSVAVRLIVEREAEIDAFKKREYWTLDATFTNGEPILAKLFAKDDKKLDKFDIPSQADADKLVASAKEKKYAVSSVQKKRIRRKPLPPFTTSTLQQDANRKLGYSSQQTMRLAQQLYEGVTIAGEGQVGLITYMRTDSVNLAGKFITDSRNMIAKEFGKEYLPAEPRRYAASSKLAQEAHEAIRPTEAARTPQSISHALDPQQMKVYELIWNRAVASQMNDAEFDSTTIDIADAAKAFTFRSTGSVKHFDGFYRVYPDAIKEVILPSVQEGQALELSELKPEQHFTEPPARFSEAGLVKALEERGIGRPSTYAPTIATIVDRGYVIKENRRLIPTDIAKLVNKVLVEHFPTIVDFQFTARMEEDLDHIAEGKKDWVPVVSDFYLPFKDNLDKKSKELDKKRLTEEKSDVVCEKCGKPMVIKTGRFGRFLACSGYPECKNTVRLNGNTPAAPEAPPVSLGKDPSSGKEIFARTGRFGSYVQLGEKTGDEKPKTASLLPGMTLESLTLEDAIALLSLPRTLGATEAGDPIIAANGKFGPYIKAGKETRSIPPDASPISITLEQAQELLRQPKVKGRASAKRLLKEVGKLPSGETISIFAGKYGPYVSDGKTNASLPKGTLPEQVTLEQATGLLEAKRAKE